MALRLNLIAAVLVLALVGCGSLPESPVPQNAYSIPSFGSGGGGR